MRAREKAQWLEHGAPLLRRGFNLENPCRMAHASLWAPAPKDLSASSGLHSHKPTCCHTLIIIIKKEKKIFEKRFIGR